MRDDPILRSKLETLLGERGKQPDHAVRFRDIARLTNELKAASEAIAGTAAAAAIRLASQGSGTTTADQLATQVADLRQQADAAADQARRAAILSQQIRDELDALTEGFSGDLNRLIERVSAESGQSLAEVKAQVNADLLALTQELAGIDQTIRDDLDALETTVTTIADEVAQDIDGLSTKIDIDRMRIWTTEDALDAIFDRLTGLQALQFATEKRITDAGIFVDPENGTVRIYGVDAVQDRLSQAQITLDAVQSEISLKASVTYVNQAISEAILDPTQIPLLGELTLRVTQAEIDLDGALATIALKADALTVEDMGVRLTAAEIDIDGLEAEIALRVTNSAFEGVEARLDAAEVVISALDGPTITQTVQSSRKSLNLIDGTDLSTLHALLQAHMDGEAAREDLAIAQTQIRAFVDEGLLAEASARTTLAATLGDGIATLQQEMTLRITENASIAAQITGLQTTMGAFSADLAANYYTKATADQAIAAATTALKSQMEGPSGSIGSLSATLTNDYYTRAAADGAIAAATAALKAEMEGPAGSVGGISANLSQNYYTAVAADAAISAAISSFEAEYFTVGGQVKATALTDYYTKATADAAIAAATTALQSAMEAPGGSIGSLSANLSQNYYTKTAADSAIAAATSALEAEYFTAGGQVKATALTNYYTQAATNSAISAATTALQSTMEGAGGSVANAQAAAQAAATLAGSKGKVFFQNTAPATAERLPQNLWIDTSGGANTPKRWSGSAWEPVTDKVATDAAAAAQAAQASANSVSANLSLNYYTKSAADQATAAALLSLQSTLTATAPRHDFFGGPADWTQNATASPTDASAPSAAWTIAAGKASTTIGGTNTDALRARGVLPARGGERIRLTIRARAVGGSGGNLGLRLLWSWITLGAWTQLSSNTNDVSVVPGADWTVHVIERDAPAGAGFLRPGLLFRGAQYSGGTVGEVELLRVENISAASEVKATLTNDYYTKTATDSAISSAVTALDTALRLPDGQIRASVLTDYYTKAATDEAISSRIETFEAEYFTAGGQVRSDALTAYITTANANNAIAASATTLNASIASVSDSVQGFQRATDAVAAVTVGNAVTVTQGGAALGQSGTIIIAEGATARSFTGLTNGAAVQIPIARAVLFAGQRVKIGILARRPASNAATRFGVCYSTNDNGGTGYIQSSQVLTTAWAWHVFHATIPQAVAGGPGYLGIFGDHDKTGKATEVAKIFIEIAAVAGELPEINTLSGQITDIRGLDVSELAGTAFGTLLSQLQVNAGGTSATVAAQGAAIATLQNGASAGYLIKAQAGGAVSLLDLIAADGSNGTVSVAKLAADDILLDGSVAARQLVITDFDGNLVRNGRFLFEDFRGWDGVPATFSIAPRDGANTTAGQSAPTAHFLRITPDSATRGADIADGVSAQAGDRFHARFAYSTEGSSPRSAALYIQFNWYDAAGNALSETSIGVPSASSTTWATFAQEVTAPANSATVKIRFRRNANGTGNAVVTNIQVTRQRDGRTFLTPNSITTGLIDTTDFNASGLAVFGGALQSSNYVAGANGAGWRIDNAGNAEFGTLALREGAVSATQALEVVGPVSSSSTDWVTAASMTVTPASNRPFILWYSGAFTADGGFVPTGPGDMEYVVFNSNEYRLLWRGVTVRQRIAAGPGRVGIIHISDVKLIDPGGTSAGTLQLQFRRGDGTQPANGTVTASEVTLVVTELKR